MDLISVLPAFNLYNYDWPIYTQYGPHPPAKLVHDANGEPGRAHDSVVSPGVVVSGGLVEESILSPGVFVGEGAEIRNSVLLDCARVGAGAVVNRVILDKNVVVPPGARIGVDREEDLARGLTVTDSGLVVAGKDLKISS
jgi:glucose-1-phosphate adenylyltransferase